MLKISKLTDYATILLAHLSLTPQGRLNVAALSQATHIAKPSVAKIMKALQQAGLVDSTRGIKGGYGLAKTASAIRAADIIDAVEGPQGLTDCAHGGCAREPSCQVGHAWQRVHRRIRQTLEDTTLFELSNLTAHHPAWVSLGAKPTRRGDLSP